MAVAKPTDLNANINVLVHEAYWEGIIPQVMLATPFTAKLMASRRVSWKGGKVIMGITDTKELTGHMQVYGENTAMTVQRSSFLENPYWDWKFAQNPIAYTMKEYIQNGGSYSEADLVKLLVSKSNRASRLGMNNMMYGIPVNSLPGGTATPYTIYTDTEGTDDSLGFQSVRHALTHGTGTTTKYGHIARDYSGPTNAYWESADLGGWASTAGVQTTACDANIDNVRIAIDECSQWLEKPGEFLAVCGPANYRKLKKWVEAKRIDTGKGELVKFGFDSFTIDNVEFVKDNWLKEANIVGGSTMFFLFHMPSWELRIHPDRSFEFTDFTWQGDKPDGLDQWVARILLAGNLICNQPNCNMFLTSMS
jgi:hypothetical protein